MNKLIGTLKEIFEERLINENFLVREFVITDNSFTKPQDILMQFVQEKCDVLEKFEIGDQVLVEFELRGRLYKEKYYNTIQALNIKKGSKT